MYFNQAKESDSVYGLVFGKGKITKVFDENSFYKIMVSFENGYEIPYTGDGIPKWGNFSEQTVFYRDDVDLVNVDFTPTDKLLSFKKIIKLRDRNKLEVRLPSGIWCNAVKCNDTYVEALLVAGKYCHFRKAKEEQSKCYIF